MKRRNFDSAKLRRTLKKNRISEGIYSNSLVYLKFLFVWLSVMLADYLLEFRFEYLWPFWLLLRSVYDSFRYQGLAFSVFFVCIAITSDMVCFLFIPVQWLFFLASTYVWVQYVWHADRGICLPTVCLWCLFIYIEASVRLRELRSLPFSLDLCRPFAAHCIGYPVVTLGFGVRSYVSYKFRLRKQKEVARENEFYMQILQEALPSEQRIESNVHLDLERHRINDRCTSSRLLSEDLISNGSAMSVQSPSKISSASRTLLSSSLANNTAGMSLSSDEPLITTQPQTIAGLLASWLWWLFGVQHWSTSSQSPGPLSCAVTRKATTSPSTSSHRTASLLSNDPATSCPKRHLHTNSCSSAGAVVQPNNIIQNHRQPSIGFTSTGNILSVLRQKAVDLSSSFSGNSTQFQQLVDSDFDDDDDEDAETNSQDSGPRVLINQKSHNSIGAQSNQTQHALPIGTVKPHQQRCSRKQRERGASQHSKDTQQQNAICLNSNSHLLTKDNNVQFSNTERDKVGNKDVALSLESDLEKLKNELRASRVLEQDLRNQLNLAQAGDKSLKSEMNQLRANNEQLQNKLHNLVKCRQQDKTSITGLEKRLQEVERAKTTIEQQLQQERKQKKAEEAAAARALAMANTNINRGECTDFCKQRRNEIEAQSKQTRRDLRQKEEQLRQLDAELQSLRKYKESHGDTELLVTALSAMRDKTAYLENSLSAETRIKLDLFSALGEAKRQLEITQNKLDVKTVEADEMRHQLFELMNGGLAAARNAYAASSLTPPPSTTAQQLVGSVTPVFPPLSHFASSASMLCGSNASSGKCAEDSGVLADYTGGSSVASCNSSDSPVQSDQMTTTFSVIH